MNQSKMVSNVLSTIRSKILAPALGVLLAAPWLLTGCKTAPNGQPVAVTPAPAAKAIRVNAGATTPYTDSAGNLWLPDQGFSEGRTVDRGTIDIAGTKDPALYRTEHYSMTAFSQPVPNGAYTVRLHFAETFSGVTEKGQRVFSLKVEDREIKDLDVLARAGGPRTAWVETVPVTVTDGKLDIVFTPGVQNPEINAIEIIPR